MIKKDLRNPWNFFVCCIFIVLELKKIFSYIQQDMALIMKYIDSMHHYMDKYGGKISFDTFNIKFQFRIFLDPRTKDFPLMSSPFQTLGICLGYVYIVKYLGPKLMENRKPLQLKNALIVYNFFQVCFSIWLFYEVMRW